MTDDLRLVIDGVPCRPATWTWSVDAATGYRLSTTFHGNRPAPGRGDEAWIGWTLTAEWAIMRPVRDPAAGCEIVTTVAGVRVDLEQRLWDAKRGAFHTWSESYYGALPDWFRLGEEQD